MSFSTLGIETWIREEKYSLVQPTLIMLKYVKICETVTLRFLSILCPSYKGSLFELGTVQGLIGHHLYLNKIKTSFHLGQYFENHPRKLYIAKILATF